MLALSYFSVENPQANPGPALNVARSYVPKVLQTRSSSSSIDLQKGTRREQERGGCMPYS